MIIIKFSMRNDVSDNVIKRLDELFIETYDSVMPKNRERNINDLAVTYNFFVYKLKCLEFEKQYDLHQLLHEWDTRSNIAKWFNNL